MCFVKNIQEHKCCSITSTVYYKIEPLKEWKSVHFCIQYELHLNITEIEIRLSEFF